MDINIQPVGNKLIVLPDPKREKTESGIIIPETASVAVALATGTVVAVSKDLPEFMKGDRILYAASAGVEMEINGIKHRFLDHQSYNSHIWGIDIRENKLSVAK